MSLRSRFKKNPVVLQQGVKLSDSLQLLTLSLFTSSDSPQIINKHNGALKTLPFLPRTSLRLSPDQPSLLHLLTIRHFSIFAVLCTQSLSHVQLSATPWTEPTRLLCPWDFSGKRYQNRLPIPSPGNLPDPGIEPASPVSPTLQSDSLPAESSWKFTWEARHRPRSLIKLIDKV